MKPNKNNPQSKTTVPSRLSYITGEQIMDMEFPPPRYVIEGLLPTGITFLGGVSKSGKPWQSLDICVHTGSGKEFWGLPVRQGTTLLMGAADTTFPLEKEERMAKTARLHCTGRDIEERQLELNFTSSCTWELVHDSLENPEILLPEEMQALVSFVRSIGSYEGSNTEFAEQFSVYSGAELTAKALKQMMNTWRYKLEELGVRYKDERSNGRRILKVFFSASDASDEKYAENDSDASAAEESAW